MVFSVTVYMLLLLLGWDVTRKEDGFNPVDYPGKFQLKGHAEIPIMLYNGLVCPLVGHIDPFQMVFYPKKN